jgi:hypothetical protein
MIKNQVEKVGKNDKMMMLQKLRTTLEYIKVVCEK